MVKFKDVKTRCISAVSDFIKKDFYLLENNANERTISARLACHLQQYFGEHSVDCEYNRYQTDPKQMGNERINPDIIIHTRGKQDNNLLVCEIKKKSADQNEKESDRRRLMRLTSQECPGANEPRYKFGLFVIFETGAQANQMPEIEFYNNGMRST